jgi:hypothetical protein
MVRSAAQLRVSNHVAALHPSRRIAEPVIGRAFARPVGDAPQDEAELPSCPGQSAKRVFALGDPGIYPFPRQP